MADVGGAARKPDTDVRQQRGKTSSASAESRKARTQQAAENTGDDGNIPPGGRHAANVSVSDSEQPRDAKRTINRSSSVAAIESELEAPLRLIVVSSKIRNSSVMQSAVWPHVVFIQYKYETTTINSCLATIAQQLGSRQVEAIAFVLHNSQATIRISGKDEAILNRDIASDKPQYEAVRGFFRSLVTTHMLLASGSCRIDFLACNAIQAEEAENIAKSLQSAISVPVFIHKDIMGNELLGKLGSELTTRTQSPVSVPQPTMHHHQALLLHHPAAH